MLTDKQIPPCSMKLNRESLNVPTYSEVSPVVIHGVYSRVSVPRLKILTTLCLA